MTYPVLAALRPPSIGEADNGHVSAEELVNIGGSVVRLLAIEAAAAYIQLRDACLVATGVSFAVMGGGAYRSYNEQVSLFQQRYETPPRAGRPTKTWQGRVWSLRAGMATAAVPGTSNHGLGAAVDIAVPVAVGGRITGYTPITGSTAWPWLLAHAVEHGWSWELQSEPWHLHLCATANIPPTITNPPQEEHDMAELGYFRDDRPTGWQIFIVATDSTGSVWCCPINDLPDKGKWDKVQPILGDPPVRSFASLAGLMDAQNRPKQPSGAVGRHFHVPGDVAS